MRNDPVLTFTQFRAPPPTVPSACPTPTSAPSTPTPKKPAKKAKAPKDVTPTTPLQKGADLADKILRKTTALCTQLSTLQFGQDLKANIEKYVGKFEDLYGAVRKLVGAKNDEESAYVPYVKQFLQLLTDYEVPKEAALGMTKSIKVRKSEPKKKASAKKPKE